MLFRLFFWTCTNIRACSQLFPILNPKYVFMHFKTKEVPSLQLRLLKVKVTLKSLLLHFKRLFCDICCNLLIISLSSKKLGNIFNCDINLLVPISSQLFSNKRVLSCNFLATNNNFWFCQKLKMWISGALFEQKRCSFDNLTHVVLWTKGELFL